MAFDEVLRARIRTGNWYLEAVLGTLFLLRSGTVTRASGSGSSRFLEGSIMAQNDSLFPSRNRLFTVGIPRFLCAALLFSAVTGLHILLGSQGMTALGLTPQVESQLHVSDQDDKVETEQTLAQEIISTVARFPKNVRNPKGMTVREIQDLTDQTLARGERYLAEYPTGEHRDDVIPVLCKLYIMNSNRNFIDSNRLYKERTGSDPDSKWVTVMRQNYFKRVLHLLEEVVSRTVEGEDVDCAVLRLKGDTFWHAQKYPQSIAMYKLVLGQCPSIDERDVISCALLNAQIRDRDHVGALSTADSFLTDHVDSDLLPHVLHLRGKALMESGRMVEALGWWRSMEDFIHSAATGKAVELNGEPVKLTAKCRKDFQRYHEEINFSMGFISFVLGDFTAAAASFREELDLLNQRQEDQKITNVGQVYISRTERVYESLIRLAGNPAPPIDLGDGWVSNVSLDPLQEQGNVMLLLFAPYGNARYVQTLENLQKLYTAHWHEGLRIAWIAIPKGKKNLPKQVDTISAEAAALDIAFPVGIELDDEYPNYRGYNCAVGGGTMIAINREGRVAWYKMDPTFRDDSIVSYVVRRLLETGQE